jgi:succinate-acetate transporter protein
LGLTTGLLQIKHTRLGGREAEELDGVDSSLLGLAILFGGLLQVLAGIYEIKRNNRMSLTVPRILVFTLILLEFGVRNAMVDEVAG